MQIRACITNQYKQEAKFLTVSYYSFADYLDESVCFVLLTRS